MVIWIGVDDTDSLRGMCTTFLATELVRDIPRKFDLIGFPRLVRLNPNVPWKTRGNGAACLRIGHGVGRPYRVGNIAGQDIVGYPRARGPTTPDGVEDFVAAHVERWSQFDDPTTNPAFVVLNRQPSPRLYWRAVREVVSRREARNACNGLGLVRTYKNGRGIVGAASATAWRPRDRTYEVLTYRRRSSWGTKREVDPRSVVEVDREFPTTFNNYDYENDCVAIAPRSPCPVLFGIRGDNPWELRSAMTRIRGEPPERWVIFETNQGTDDHVHPRKSGPRTTVRVSGSVSFAPRTLVGGHVVFKVGGLDVTTYEPSKQFRLIVRQLVSGDRVEVVGAIRSRPRTLNLEKLRIDALAQPVRKVANPFCAACGKHAKSLGRRGGFRCPRCGAQFPRSAATFMRIPRSLKVRWYEPPVGSRRHLSRPLKRAIVHGTAFRKED